MNPEKISKMCQPLMISINPVQKYPYINELFAIIYKCLLSSYFVFLPMNF